MADTVPAKPVPAEPEAEPQPQGEPKPPCEPEPELRPEPQRGGGEDGEAERLPPPGAEEAAAGDAEGPPTAAGGAARPGLGPRYRAAVGRAEEWPVKKKHRRRPSKKKRRWKPYSKLSWEEKQQFDERQSLRASRLRAEMFAKGQPVAPYNTTQFLMEDHDQEEPDLKTGLYPRRAAAKSDDTSEEDFLEEAADEDGGSDGMGGDGSEFLQRDFSETYERYHVESLSPPAHPRCFSHAIPSPPRSDSLLDALPVICFWGRRTAGVWWMAPAVGATCHTIKCSSWHLRLWPFLPGTGAKCARTHQFLEDGTCCKEIKKGPSST